ncbi:MAG: ABC transporter ATP-binding protein [Planctomycetes bacterium]|nr:ABC transporter ATP-binding protein [Planctomycetota bacterium]
MPSQDGALEAKEIYKDYRTAAGPLRVLNGINLRVEKGEIVAVVGPSGSGKSTLLHILGILDTPTAGMVFYDGENLNVLGARQQAAKRNKLFGFVFQFYHLLPDFDALENVMMPQVIGHGMFGWQRAKQRERERAADLLKRIGLGARLTHRPSQLSGGESQRVAIARALMNQPAVLLCDEPTGNLDTKTGKEIRDVIWGLNAEQGQTVVIVTHDEHLARAATRMVRMVDGRILE